MSKILIVDDSAVARHTIARILGQEKDLEVATAVDGAAALLEIERFEPDAVVTDLVMPNLDGLALVAAMRTEYPHIPAILVTSEGSEDIAARALREGAASYVPKEDLERELPTTVKRILGLAKQERTRLALLSTLTTAELTFVLNNDPKLLPSLVQHLQDCMRHMGFITQADLIRISVALEEALVNAMYHGNLEVSSDLRNKSDNTFYQLARQRRLEDPYQDRKIHVSAILNDEAATFVIRDEGPGFDPHMLPDPTDASNLDKLSGRGVMLMMTFLDEVRYNAAGNEVTLVRKCDVPA